jgi:uroporphyrinogen decarboxylase
MNAIERTYLALQHKQPDRVPVDFPNFMVTARRMGTSDFAAFFQDGEAMAEGQIESWRRFGHDVLTIENGTAALAAACGVEVVYQSGTAPVAKEPAIRSLDEVDRLKIPDPYTDPLLREMLKATRLISQEIGRQAFIKGRGDQGPFSLACEIRGMSQFMLDLALGEQEEQIHQLLDFCREACYRYCLAQIEQGAHATSIGDSPSGPDLLSPRFYRKYAWPYVKRLVDDLHAKDVILSYHICGNATPIVADMVASGANMLELDQKAELRLSKQAAQGKAAIIGPVDPSEVMANGTPELVVEKCKQAIAVLAPGGGFFLAPGCALPPSTPDENLDAMVAAAHEFGTYPIFKR